MSVMLLPLAAEPAATTPAPDPASLLEELAALRLENVALCAENAALRVENAALHERIRELEARLGQTSANSSRPPSSDPPQAPARPKARRPAGGVADSEDTAGRTVPCCRSSRWTRSWRWCQTAAGIVGSRSTNPPAAGWVGSGGTRSWSYFRSRYG